MNEQYIDDSVASGNDIFTLKILFGPMFGCELSLPADDYFFNIHPGIRQHNICNDTQKEIENLASFTCKTLYIPCESDSPNLLLHLSKKSKTDGKQGYIIDILSIDGSISTLIEENVIFQHKNIRLAFKKNENKWSEEISTCNWHKKNISISSSEIDIQKENFIKLNKITYCFLTMIILFICGLVFWYKHSQQSNNVVSLNAALAGSPAPLKIIKSDNNIYIFGDGYQEIAWLNEVLYKMNEGDKVTPVWTQKMRKEVIKKLHNKGFPALQLDLTMPEFPQLYTYRKLDNEQEASLKEQAHQMLPYAKHIDVFFKEKELLVKEAQHGLERIQIPYLRISTGTGYALIIKDDLSDSSINSLNGFITEFYNQWGDQIVNFSINMNENTLKDKSYFNAKEGYIFISPQHWYFPLNKKDINYG